LAIKSSETVTDVNSVLSDGTLLRKNTQICYRLLTMTNSYLGWIKIGLYNIGLSTGSDFWQGLNVFPFKKPNKLFKVAEDFSRWY